MSNKATKKRKTEETESESSSAPKLRRSSRFASQGSELTEAIRDLALSSDTYGVVNLPNSASLFKPRDIVKLNVSFERASAENVVIPDVQGFQANLQKLDKYFLPAIDTEVLGSSTFNIRKLVNITNDKVQTFVTKLHQVVLNGVQVVGTDETFTDTLVDNLLRITKLDNYPLMIRNHPKNFLYIDGEATFSSDSDFVVKYENLSVLVIEDKHLKNVTSATGYGESQIAAEILACGSSNLKSLGGEEPTDQTILAMRVISSFVTFYRAVITSEYWKELESGLPKDNSVRIQRWPAGNGLKTGFDLAEPAGRQKVFEALVKIRESFLVESNDE